MTVTKVSELSGGNLQRFPLLPLRDIVVFPTMVVPLFVGREKSIRALEAAMADGKLIFLAAQKNAKTEDPRGEDIFSAGSLCKIIQLLKLPDGTVKVLVEGKQRGTIVSLHEDTDYFVVSVELVQSAEDVDAVTSALTRSVHAAFEKYAKTGGKIPAELVSSTLDTTDPDLLADSVVGHLSLKLEEKQEFLSLIDPARRLEKLLGLLESELEILQIEKKIRSRVKKQMERSQKEYYLNEQMRAIQKELGNKDDFRQELQELEAKLESLKLPPEARQKGTAELKKLRLMSPMSAEAAVVRNYLDWLVSVPWNRFTREKRDMAQASAILERDHYGLEKVKERILEQLSVHVLSRRIKGPILCLVGPPGVGKTSLARSIAEATGRKFIKVSLGGVRDESEIRGHRRTYVGAMPGKIIHGLKRAGTSNPLFLLDEIDKLSSDFRGDPASALLEVLDPEQNALFNDHFLDVEYNLSRIMFITTANSLHSIPRPLLDRMEVIKIDGYTELEKLNIAQQYLVAKQREANGLSEGDVCVADDALLQIIRGYTREAGVRNLDRSIGKVFRKIAHKKVTGASRPSTVSSDNLRDFLGLPLFRTKANEAAASVGVVTGLAWTETGGDLLDIEVAVLPGKGKLNVTGKLGEVMQESAQTAMTYVRSRGELLGLERDFYQNADIHIHVPEGAIPKDGPSAGITMATALVSALTGRGVAGDIAMTGEITLRGRVLAIGGLKEKLLAARRGGIRTVLIPKENERDLLEIPAEVTESLEVIPVAHMDDVLARAVHGYAELVRVQDAAMPCMEPLHEHTATSH